MRIVTEADQKRVSSYRVPAKGAFGDLSPPGKWTLHVKAVWAQPNPDEPNLFCEPERPGDYTWSLSGSSLTITAKQKVCADRDTVLVGSWARA